MLASNEDHFGSPKESWRRSPRAGWPFRLAALALAAAGLVALAPASARGNLVVVHSAKSGTLAGDRLTLHGVGRRVTWVANSGRSGVVSIARLHRRLFLPGRRGPRARSISRASAAARSWRSGCADRATTARAKLCATGSSG
jgi:hypothetical protein